MGVGAGFCMYEYDVCMYVYVCMYVCMYICVCILRAGVQPILWTHTLRPLYSRPIALTQEGRSLVNMCVNVCVTEG